MIVLIVLGFITNIEPYIAVLLFVLLGQAHFSLTYLEQFRQRKYTTTGFSHYILFLLLALAALHMNVIPFVIFVSIFFLLHNFFDDMKLLRSSHRGYAIICTLPIFLFLSLASYDSLAKGATLEVATAPLFLCFIGISALAVMKKNIRSDGYIRYILSVTFLLMVFFIVYPEIGTERLFAFIIVTHYLNWYWHIYKKYEATNPIRVRPYILECLGVNAVIILVFLCFIFVYGGISDAVSNPIYKLIYTPYYFYAWTLMHLMVTLRTEDYVVTRKKIIAD